MIFDARTALLITGLLYLLMPLVVWLALRELKNPSVALWCGGGELFGLGLLFMSLRGHSPEWLSFEAANFCIYVGSMLRIQALHKDLHQPLPWSLFAAICSIFSLGYLIGRWMPDGMSVHFIWSALVVSAQCVWIALLARRIALDERIATAGWLGIAYLPLAITLSARAVQVGAGSATPGLLIDEYMPMAIALSGIFAAVMGNTGFLGMFVERAARRQVEQAKEKARRQENDRLGRQIAHLDRQRGMGMLAMSLAHELGQPLTNISLIAEHAALELRRGQAPASALLEQIQEIRRNSGNAIDIMARIRGFIKATPPEHQRISLQDVCTNVMRLMNDWLRSERIQMQWHAPEEALHAQGDPVQLAQILVNLIRNSGQATAGQAQRRITLTLTQDGAHARLQVQDNGCGFSQACLQNDAPVFYTTKQDGLGVGLAISRHIAEQHRGHLTMSNAPEGGAIVRLTLPLV